MNARTRLVAPWLVGILFVGLFAFAEGLGSQPASSSISADAGSTTTALIGPGDCVDCGGTPTYPCTLGNGCPGTKTGTTGRCMCAGTEGLGQADCSGQCSNQPARLWCNSACETTFCQALTTTTETCDGCDNDRNGAVDNASGSYVSNTMTIVGNAACSTPGTRTCVNGAWSAPSGCGGTAKCQSPRCDYQDGTQPCDSSCNLSGACTATEQCDGCDNDQNGEADEGLQCPQCNL